MKKFYLNPNDIWISGVCSGLADYTKIDTLIIRFLTFSLLFVFPIYTFIIYFFIATCATYKE